MPEDVRTALSAKGLVWWVRGMVEITLEGYAKLRGDP